MFTVLACVHDQHDLRLVVLAALICVLAVASAFTFFERGRRDTTVFRAGWLALTGLVGGSGVWATHFIAMLAYEPKLNIHYDIAVTAVSWIVAVIGVGGGFALAAWLKNLRGRVAGGALVGLSVAAMHYLGMAAVRMNAEVIWRPEFVVASFVIGLIGAAAAIAVDDGRPGLQRRIGGPALLVAAIVGLHFTGMAATVLLPTNAAAMPASLVGRDVMAGVVGGLVVLLFAAAGGLIWVERAAQGSTFRGVRASLNALASGIAFFDHRDRLLVWNATFETMMGGALRAGSPLTALLGAGLAENAISPELERNGELRRRMATSSTGVFELESQLSHGRWMKLEARATSDGGMALVLTDTTAANDYARALADARDAAESANRAKSEFLANMSHELRTPLNGVLGIAEALARTNLDRRQAQMLDIIRDSGGALEALLGDLLDLARAESGGISLDPQPVAVADLCAAAAAQFATRAAGKHLKLEVKVDPGAQIQVLADPLRLRQILTNLVGNAVKFTHNGGVTLSANVSNGRLQLVVSDTGVGFDPNTKDRLFQRFRQADGSATRVHGGVGLGLPLCLRLAELMDGVLDCDSTPGVGSTFTFEAAFPIIESAADIGAGETDRAARVLVVDDNATNRHVLELILESVGVEHAAAENGQEAVDAVQAGEFDAVLMDIQMPVMDGLEATRRIRAWETRSGHAHRPIIIVSANCMPDHVAAGQAAGADAHIAKPVSAAKVLSALAGVTAQAA